ncbi:NADH-quinone oxidoreductase subunit J [Caulobacter ginsengisoli]|uniref:NADH-quinone oxidoreductase subunit J n=1 Tax=Caulobacter ginsengisoli TaxID=400775 RepID=A0ABU0ILV7_9CAUL|nr:NADH-quinone oxidoreductase subunit J [Caulobacter ginsengisoli]MDQ0462995.1 NADH-quinone oxidoreductase subunit J [Caulobacter ginsengisoli]
MPLQAIAFYLMAAVTIAAGLGVVSARNPVHSVLFLITAFFSAAGLFVLLGAEFLAMLLVVVYVGAVAVLFLFVVMMLDIDFAALKQGFARYMPIGLVVAGVLVLEMIFVTVSVANGGKAGPGATPQASGVDISNVETIGRVLYTDYAYFFEAAGMVLLVAMIGAIVLTLRHKPGVKRQNIGAQVARGPKTGMTIVDIGSGASVDEGSLNQ